MTKFIESLGIAKESYQLREHNKEELSHYSLATTDVQYQFPFGAKELCGIANRGNFDLLKHSEASKTKFLIDDATTNKPMMPLVVEPSMGIERLFLAIICENLIKEEIDSKKRIVLKLNPLLAPYHVAVASLNKKKLGAKAQEVFSLLTKSYMDVFFEQKSEIGKVYNYHDQIGTLYCVTVDYQTLEDSKVTVRDRDTMNQERVSINNLKTYLYQKLNIVF